MMGTWRDSEPIDQRTLDRLTDGELNEEEERAIIAQLADTPGGWQRCALTFLEHRCWQRVTEPIAAPRRARSPETAAGPTVRTRRTWQGAHLLAAAAALLLAVGVGTFLPRFPFHGPRGPGSPAAQPPVWNPLTDTPLAHDTSSRVPDSDMTDELYLGDLTLVSDSGQEIDVPVYDWDQQVATDLLYQTQPLPAELMQRLKRHQVRSSRSYLPVTLQDGRQVVLPVQEVDITPVRGVAY